MQNYSCARHIKGQQYLILILVRFGPAGEVREAFELISEGHAGNQPVVKRKTTIPGREKSAYKGLVRGGSAQGLIFERGEEGLKRHEPWWMPKAGEVGDSPVGVRPLMPCVHSLSRYGPLASPLTPSITLLPHCSWLHSSTHLSTILSQERGSPRPLPADLSIWPFLPFLLHPPVTGLRESLFLRCDSICI